MKTFIDINCDLGEIEASWKSGRDRELMQYLNSVNISCGAHAGSPQLIKETIEEAVRLNLNIGAHPSFPDKKNFGRKEMRFPEKELRDICFSQIAFLKNLVEEEGGRLHHVKAHGALYQMSGRIMETASSICEAIRDIDSSLIVFCQPNTVLDKVSRNYGLEVWSEAFVDRSYENNGLLTSRNEKNALITKPKEALKQVETIVKEGFVWSLERERIPIKAQTFCIHGDQESALAMAKLIQLNFVGE